MLDFISQYSINVVMDNVNPRLIIDTSQSRDQIEQKITSMPLLSAVVTQLVALDPDDDNFLTRIHQLAQQDPTFSMRLIQYASKTLMIPRSADKLNLKNAIARLGSRKIAGIAVTMWLMHSFQPRTAGEHALWIHSVQVAVITRRLTAMLPGQGLDPEVMYLAALLHDIGRFVIYQAVPDGPGRIDEHHWTSKKTLLEAEINGCGIDHVEVGKKVCRQWGIPFVISEIIAHHHDYDYRAETLEERQLCKRLCLIQMADNFSVAMMNGSIRKLLEQNREASEIECINLLIAKMVKEIPLTCSAIQETQLLALTPAVVRQLRDIHIETDRILSMIDLSLSDDNRFTCPL